MEKKPCEFEKKELEKAKSDLRIHKQDPLNRYDDDPKAYKLRMIELENIVKEKEIIFERCFENKK